MAKITIQPNPHVKQIFQDLEKYLDFCRDYGYKYNEKELYDNKSYIYRQFTKYVQGKNVTNNWEVDGSKLN